MKPSRRTPSLHRVAAALLALVVIFTMVVPGGVARAQEPAPVVSVGEEPIPGGPGGLPDGAQPPLAPADPTVLDTAEPVAADAVELPPIKTAEPGLGQAPGGEGTPQEGVVPAGTTADDPNEIKFLDGAAKFPQRINCITGNFETVANVWVGYMGNTAVTSPMVGDVFYGRVMVAGLGNPCAGPYAHIEINPPPGAFLLNPTAQWPVRCFVADLNGSGEFTEFTNDTECPKLKALRLGNHAYVFDQTDGTPWPLPRGRIIQIWYPMYATQRMSGLATNSILHGYVQIMTGSGSLDTFTDAQQGVFVAENPPAVEYPSPSTTEITNTTAKTTAYLYNHFKAGQAFFDFGTTTNYGTVAGPVAVPETQNANSYFATWGQLVPGTTYHWRLRFRTPEGLTFTGADQTFTTTGVAPVSPGPRTDDTSPGVTYQGWSSGLFPQSTNSFRVATIAGQSVAYRTDGATRAVTLHTWRGPNQGMAEIFINGQSKGTLDLYSPTAGLHAQTYGGLTRLRQIVEVRVLGTKNPASTGKQVRVDGFGVGTTKIEETSPAVRYSSWVGTTNAAAHGGSYRSTATANATASFRISGGQFTWVTARGPNMGQAQVIVDRQLKATVDLYNPTAQVQHTLAFTGLGTGAHNVTIKVLGTKHANASAANVVFDGYSVP